MILVNFTLLISPKEVLSAPFEGLLRCKRYKSTHRLRELGLFLLDKFVDLGVRLNNFLKFSLPDQGTSLGQHSNELAILVAECNGCDFDFGVLFIFEHGTQSFDPVL